jgi:hypothetical protein
MSITDSITETVNSFPEWTLTTLKSGNDAVLAATKKMVEAIEPMTNKIPSTPLTERLSSLPQPGDVLSQWFSYVEKVIAEQKRFGLHLAGTVAATQPAAPAPARKTTAPKAACAGSRRAMPGPVLQIHR